MVQRLTAGAFLAAPTFFAATGFLVAAAFFTDSFGIARVAMAVAFRAGPCLLSADRFGADVVFWFAAGAAVRLCTAERTGVVRALPVTRDGVATGISSLGSSRGPDTASTSRRRGPDVF